VDYLQGFAVSSNTMEYCFHKGYLYRKETRMKRRKNCRVEIFIVEEDGIIKVLEGLPNLLSIFHEGLS